ncbi:MAG: type II secretion system F family protein [Thermoguttaceae bacterium]
MLFSPRIKIGPLAALCRRQATALGAGIDVRTAWDREVDRASGHADRARMTDVSEAVDRGEPLAAALADTGDYFPTLFRELTDVGEQTGHLSEVFARLAENYEDQVKMRRVFLAAIAWPVFQLIAAVLIIGFLIWIMGVIGNGKIDPLGFGLVGNTGLAIYVVFVAGIAAAIFVLVEAIRRGRMWTRPIQQFVMRLPGIGKPLTTLALARLAWSMHLTMKTGMEVRRALRLSLQSTRNAIYTDQIDPIDAEIAAGNSVYEAFRSTGSFPADFLDTLAVGEQSGRIVESMERLSRQYHDYARTALATLNVLAGFAVWGVIAAIIIVMIFRLFGFYVGMINDAMPP